MSNQTISFGDVGVKDVAKVANVSIATVSRVLNASPAVREKTKLKVMEAVNNIGYVPNYRARSFRSKKSHVIAIVLPTIGSGHDSGYVVGAEKALKSLGYMGHFVHVSSEKDALDVVELFNNRRCDGVLFLHHSRVFDSALIEIGKRNIPAVILNWNSPEVPVKAVSVNNYKGGRLVAEHFIEHGHKDIMFLGGQGNWNVEQNQRLESFTDSLNKAGVFNENRIVHCSGWDSVAGYQAAVKIAENGDLPTAIFCYSDLIAYGVLSAFYDLKISVPDQISIVGYSDHEFSRFCCPTLTSVSCPDEKLGFYGANMLINMVDDVDDTSRKALMFDPQLVVRKSSGSCKDKMSF